jgi:ADP-ribose pyrophosphatase YjhB (NUDIX family)
MSSSPDERVFMRLSKTSQPPRMDEVPDGGLCLSSFLVISRSGRQNHVLMGILDPKAPWERIGALDSKRAELNSRGWMLPSSHLLLHESPQEAASRIAREQLEIEGLRLQGPLVFSEVYGPKKHWDIEFVFLGEMDQPPKASAWSRLEFVDTSTLRRPDFARSHEDILEHVGMWREA